MAPNTIASMPAPISTCRQADARLRRSGAVASVIALGRVIGMSFHRESTIGFAAALELGTRETEASARRIRLGAGPPEVTHVVTRSPALQGKPDSATCSNAPDSGLWSPHAY